MTLPPISLTNVNHLQIKQRELKTKNIARIVSLFKELDVDVVTKWRTAQQRVMECDEWRENEELRTLGPLDMLLAFEDYSRAQERIYQEETQKKAMEKARKERKARDAFRVSQLRLDYDSAERMC